MKQRTYRFLPEYANEKKDRIKQLSANYTENDYIKDASEIAIKRIDKILVYAQKGFITLDEAMHDISEINVMEYVYFLRTLQYDKLPLVE